MGLPPPDLPQPPTPATAQAESPAHAGSALRRWLVPLALVLFGVVIGGLLFTVANGANSSDADADLDAAIEAALAEATPAAAFSAEVYQAILPSLVYIQVERVGDEEPIRGVGTGVIVNDDGDILTSLHVVDESTAIRVIFADGSSASAEVSSSEPENDIAVLSADGAPEVIVPAIIGNTRTMRTGDEVFAVGNPLGLSGSMSAGVISGFDRSIPVPGRPGATDGDSSASEDSTNSSGDTTTEADTETRILEGLIQFDAAVNPGNSGGPLLNRDGQVIGIVTALANPADQAFFVGIGFAVPIGTASNAAGGPAQ